MRRYGSLWCVAVLVAVCAPACGRTDLFDGEVVEPTVTVDSGIDARADSEDSSDAYVSPFDAPEVAAAKCPVTPPATSWGIPLTADPTNGLSYAEAFAVAVDSDGSVFSAGCGNFYGCADYSHGAGPCFVMKTSPDGHFDFIDRFTDGDDEKLTVGLTPDGHGGVIIGLADDEGTDLGGGQPVGCVVERIDGEGNVLFAHPLGGAFCKSTHITSVDQGRPFAFAGDGAGNSLIVAVCGDACEGKNGALALYLDPVGNTLARNVIVGSNESVRLDAAALQADGSSFIGGFVEDGVDFGDGMKGLGQSAAFAAYDPSHKLVKSLVVNDDLLEMQAVPTPDGKGFLVAGTIDRSGIDLGGGPLPFSGMNPNGGPNADIFLAEFTTGLDHVFSNAWGDGSVQSTVSLCTDPDGTITWVGSAGYETYFGNFNVGGDPTTPDDGFLIRLSPEGVPTTPASPEPDLGVDQIACIPQGYVMVGNAQVDTTSFLGRPFDAGSGFIVKGPRP